MGTAEFYDVVEAFDEVADSLVIDTTGAADEQEGRLLCFLVLAEGASFGDVESRLRSALRSELSPRHVPDAFIVVGITSPLALRGLRRASRVTPFSTTSPWTVCSSSAARSRMARRSVRSS